MVLMKMWVLPFLTPLAFLVKPTRAVCPLSLHGANLLVAFGGTLAHRCDSVVLGLELIAARYFEHLYLLW